MASQRWRETAWYDPRVVIRPSGIQGGGMFALGPIHAGETVGSVGGTLMAHADFATFRATVERYNQERTGRAPACSASMRVAFAPFLNERIRKLAAEEK